MVQPFGSCLLGRDRRRRTLPRPGDDVGAGRTESLGGRQLARLPSVAHDRTRPSRTTGSPRRSARAGWERSGAPRTTKLGREVALKVLPAAFGEDAERLERFEREAKVLASLNHPNIAHLYGIETVQACHSERAKRVEESPEDRSDAEEIASSRASGGPSTPASSDDASAQGDIRSVTFLVMELVEGEDLSARIARGAIPSTRRSRSLVQIAEALEAAHEAGIVHRDLKPANIKIRTPTEP